MDAVFLEHSVRASLVDFLERRVLCVLRDGKVLVGTLISFDQFYNLVLMHTVKRIVVDKMFAEEDIGVFVIRGENVATLSELDMEREANQTGLKRVSMKRIREAQQAAARKSTRKASLEEFDGL
ncbi:U6 snRNA-associated Sm-like protein LSm1 [Plasmodiophora brassicae]|uniref:U6 snRNA-associated Sm-like protein LSm1 n=1 Tax=Plasmodiophora brassicae TaxID=37360 RepID=A0A0G4IMS0_PLABS|nr:hypothetical protein PBRA_005076 [Plasmodiophora brassicae]SPQ99345.1 unnamed protein product [Plasmodiophora brassicae]